MNSVSAHQSDVADHGRFRPAAWPGIGWALLFASLMISPIVGGGETDVEAARGMDIARERKLRDLGWNAAQAPVEMVLQSRSGSEVVRALRMRMKEVANDGNKSLIIFDSPGDVRGTVVLTHSHIHDPDDQWVYLPSINRTKRVSSSNQSGAFMGSEFAFEDLSSYEVEKYSHRYLGEDTLNDQAMYRLESVPEYAHSGYTRLVAWIDQDHFRLWKTEYYDKKGELLKTLEVKDYSKHQGKWWRAGAWHMVNHQTGRSTVLKFLDYDFDVAYGNQDFNATILNRVR